jgi:Reverse transcriptase (RNA-dependent DNA polymerase)
MKLSPGRNQPSLKSPDGRLITDSLEKANTFNQYFASVFTIDDNKIPVCSSSTNENCMQSDVEFCPAKVYKSLKSLKPKCSYGPDGLPSILLHNLARVLSEPLSFIFDSSFRSGVLPACWVNALVTPVFKKGATSSPSNYRPISLICICCGIMERIINADITDYLHTNIIIYTAQHGFFHKHSTCTDLLESVHDWSVAFNNQHSIDIVYIDFQKAFDTVSHANLIPKLEMNGLTGFLLKWIEAFLSNRTQSVKILNCISDKICVTSGVPQGSVLGPMLFLMFINYICDVVSDLNVTKTMFADDAKIYSVLH